MKSFAPIFIVLLIVAGFAFILTRDNADVVTPKNTSSVSDPVVDERNDVTVTVQPISISSESPEWKFDITMSTHSVELDHNLSEAVVLVGAGGEVYKPIAWQGSEASGHHRDNTVIFNPIVPVPEVIELRIEGVGGQDTRVFRWNVDQ